MAASTLLPVPTNNASLAVSSGPVIQSRNAVGGQTRSAAFRSILTLLTVPALVVPFACTTESESTQTQDDSEDADDTNVRADDADESDETDDEGQDASSDDDESPGSFSAIWRQASAEVMVIDPENPIPKSVEVEIPSSLPFPESEREVELFEQIKDGHHVTYAWVQGAPQYYRITTEAIGSDDGYVIQQGDAVRSYLLSDGKLTSTTTMAIGTNIIQSFTAFEEYRGAFPPDGWPSDVVDAELGAVQ